MLPFRFLDTGRRPENGLAAVFLSAHDGGVQSRVRTGGEQSNAAVLFCFVEAAVLYVEFMAMSLFIQGTITAMEGGCDGVVQCGTHICTGLLVYSLAVAYFIVRYSNFFGEASMRTVVEGIGMGTGAMHMGFAPLAVLLVHVAANTAAAAYLLPDGSMGWSNLAANPVRTARTLLYTPVLEELIFRGLFPALVYNRCRDPKPVTCERECPTHLPVHTPCLPLSALHSLAHQAVPRCHAANALFAIIHITNLVSGGPPLGLVLLQCGQAFCMGLYYATRHARSGGSLWECVLLHSVNNLLAVLFNAQVSRIASMRLRSNHL